MHRQVQQIRKKISATPYIIKPNKINIQERFAPCLVQETKYLLIAGTIWTDQHLEQDMYRAIMQLVMDLLQTYHRMQLKQKESIMKKLNRLQITKQVS